MNSMGISNGRWRHVGLIILLSLFSSAMALIFLWSNAQAGFFAGGAGGCGEFIDAVNLASPGDAILQMIPDKSTDGVTITKDLRIMGGWNPSPSGNCNGFGANPVFSTTADFLTAGFTYTAPYSRSGLFYFDLALVIDDPNDPNFPNIDRLILEHLAIEGGFDNEKGGAIRGVISDSADLLLDNLLIHFSDADNFGGGVYLEVRGGSHLRIEDTIFDDNRAVDFDAGEVGVGGGLYVILREESKLTIENTQFLSNTAEHAAGLEIHVYDDSEVVMSNVTFASNDTELTTSVAAAGRLFVQEGKVTIMNSAFLNNDTAVAGGGLYLDIKDGEVNVHNTRFDGNLADISSGQGGGLYGKMDGGTLNIFNSSFINNEAGDEGGGLYVESIGNSDAHVLIANTSFSNNTPNDYHFPPPSGTGSLNTTFLDQNVLLPTILNNPNKLKAEITTISLDENHDYVVEFETSNFVPTLPGTHVHFFFDTVAPEDAGVPGSGPWILYGGSSPFTQYKFADRDLSPYGPEKMCILVANPDHSVQLKTGNCVKLP